MHKNVTSEIPNLMLGLVWEITGPIATICSIY